MMKKTEIVEALQNIISVDMKHTTKSKILEMVKDVADNMKSVKNESTGNGKQGRAKNFGKWDKVVDSLVNYYQTANFTVPVKKLLGSNAYSIQLRFRKGYPEYFRKEGTVLRFTGGDEGIAKLIEVKSDLINNTLPCSSEQLEKVVNEPKRKIADVINNMKIEVAPVQETSPVDVDEDFEDSVVEEEEEEKTITDMVPRLVKDDDVTEDNFDEKYWDELAKELAEEATA